MRDRLPQPKRFKPGKQEPGLGLSGTRHDDLAFSCRSTEIVQSLACISHQLSSRGRRGAVLSGVFDLRGAERVLAVRRAPRCEKTPLGATYRRPQQKAGEICGLGLAPILGAIGSTSKLPQPQALLHAIRTVRGISEPWSSEEVPSIWHLLQCNNAERGTHAIATLPQPAQVPVAAVVVARHRSLQTGHRTPQVDISSFQDQMEVIPHVHGCHVHIYTIVSLQRYLLRALRCVPQSLSGRHNSTNVYVAPMWRESGMRPTEGSN